MQFRYLAYTLDQGIIRGKLEAHDENEARAELVEQGYKPLQVTRSLRLPSLEKIIPSLYQVKGAEVFAFAQTMSTMLNSGANLLRILDMLEEEAAGKGMRNILKDIRQRVSEGESFSRALREHDDVFDEVFITLAEVGEYTGRLGPALDQLSALMGQAAEAKKRAIQAMMMPAIMITMSMGMLGFMALVMLPPMFDSFGKMGVEIPVYTEAMIASVTWIKVNILQVLMGAAIAFGIYKGLERMPATRYLLHLGKAKAPIFGGLTLAGELGRYARILGVTLDSGVDLPSALRLGLSGSKNEALRRAWSDANESLMSGHRMVESLRDHSIIPRMFVELMGVGEESNTLPKTMNEIGIAYQKQFEEKIGVLLTVGETLSTVAVGGVTMFMAFSVVIPIFNAASSF